MNIYWISWIFLTLCISGAADAQIYHYCNEEVLAVQVAVNATVSVSCPNKTGNEMVFRLHKNQTKVDSYHYKRVNDSGKTMFSLKEGRSLWVDQPNSAASFELSGLTAEQTGLYACEVSIYLPPPALTYAQKTLVIVEGPCGGKSQGQSAICMADVSTLSWGWRLGFGTVITYGLVVTVIAFVIWFKLRRLESTQNDYENTKPGMPLGFCKKKQGVQHPLLTWR